MKYLLAFSLVFWTFTSFSQSRNNFQFQTGDLVFQDLDCGDLCNAIEQVTPSVNNKHFSHVGMIYVVQDSVWVIEAIGKDVHLTKLEDFLKRQTDDKGNPKVIVERLKRAYQPLNTKAISFALNKIGIPYDDEFRYDNGKYYCSELIYDAYKTANNNVELFNFYPMTFKDPQNHKTMPVWKNYFKKLHEKIPEGRLGCNPGSIAVSDMLEIVKEYY